MNMKTFAKTTAQGVPMAVPMICRKKRSRNEVTLCRRTRVSAVIRAFMVVGGSEVKSVRKVRKRIIPASMGIEG
jgi:hypothetical protein